MINQAQFPSRDSPPPKFDLHFQESIMKRYASGRDNVIVPALVHTLPLSVNTVPASVNTALGSMDKKKPLALLNPHMNALCVRMIHTVTCLQMMNSMKASYLWCPRKPQSSIVKRCNQIPIPIPSISIPTGTLSKGGRQSPKEQQHNSTQVLKTLPAVTHPLIPHREI